MIESPRYPTIGTPQTIILDSSQIPVGYTVAVCLAKGAVQHIESKDVIVGADKVAELTAGNMTDFAAWIHARIDEHELTNKANAALDAL